MARRYLKQKTTGELYVWTPQLAKRDDMEEYIETLPLQNDDSYTPTIQRIQSDVIRFFLSARGLGDCVTGLYTACGLADAGYAVEFFTPRTEWLKVSHPGVKIIQGEDGFNANANYLSQLHECRSNGMSRCDWYLNNIAQAYSTKKVKASRPNFIETFKHIETGDYVLLCPFSIAVGRTWHAAHWRRLALMLLKAGIQVVAMGQDRHQEQIDEMFYGLKVKKYIQASTDTVLSLVQHAMCTVSNDSGPAHLGGLYGKKTIAIISQFRPEYLYDCAHNLEAVQPKSDCVSCHESNEGGWDQFCHGFCSALQLVDPQDIFRKITQREPDIKQMAQVLLKRKPKKKESDAVAA